MRGSVESFTARLTPRRGALHSLFEIGRDLRLNHRFEVASGVLAEEGAARLKAFFSKLRAGSVVG